MITSPNESATPRWPSACVVESTMIAPQPANTSAKVPNTSAPSRRASGATLPGSGERDWSRDDSAESVERAVGEAEVREAAALLALEEPGIGEQLEVVGDRRLLEAERLGEVADADRLAPCLREHVEDLDAVAVGERLEERRAGDRCAAGDEREDLVHGSIISNVVDANRDRSDRG